jgi:hypothetical protein
VAAIGRAAGKVAGLTSTDFVRVGDDVLEQGDYSGPGGARLLLRDKRLEIAALEVARAKFAVHRGLAPGGALTLKPDVVVATDLLGYLRGRNAREIPEIIKQTCLTHSMQDSQILTASSPLDATLQILDLVQPGDIALLLVLSEREEVFELLAQRSA